MFFNAPLASHLRGAVNVLGKVGEGLIGRGAPTHKRAEKKKKKDAHRMWGAVREMYTLLHGSLLQLPPPPERQESIAFL